MIDRLKRIHPLWWLVVFFLLVNVLWLGPTLFASRTLSAGIEAPDFVLPDVGSGTGEVRLSSLRESTVVLVFWATWCDACLAEMQVIRSLYGSWVKEGVQVIGMNMEPENRAMVSRFLVKHPLPYRNVSVDGTTAAAYQVKILPTIYVIDARGKVCDGITGRVGSGRLKKAVVRCGR